MAFRKIALLNNGPLQVCVMCWMQCVGVFVVVAFILKIQPWCELDLVSCSAYTELPQTYVSQCALHFHMGGVSLSLPLEVVTQYQSSLTEQLLMTGVFFLFLPQAVCDNVACCRKW